MVVEDSSWKDEILATLSGAGDVKVKALRKMVLVARQLDENDKNGKKAFKKTIKAMEEDKTLKVSSDGQITLLSKKRKNKDEKESSSTKKKKKNKSGSEKKTSKKSSSSSAEEASSPAVNNHAAKEEGNSNDIIETKDNPDGITRLFVGNLPFKVDEDSLSEFLPGVTHIKWITDKETGRFYGSSFVEMENVAAAENAVAKSGESLMGRPIKVNYAPPRSGEVWPPTKRTVKGNEQVKKQRPAGGVGIHAMSKKPEDCQKLFVGNLSYDVDDDVITKFFAAVNAEVKAIRWIHHKDTGFFKGVGFIEFWNTEACEKAATLNGKNLLGRPVRIDWTD